MVSGAAGPTGSIVTDGNSGDPITYSGAPGVTGESPSAFHTYQPERPPRSSLPGRPSGFGRNTVRSERVTAAVRHGARANVYIHGTWMSCSSGVPALSGR